MPDTPPTTPAVTIGEPEALAELVRDSAARRVAVVDYGVAHAGVGHPPPPPDQHVRLTQRGKVLEHYARDFVVRAAAGVTMAELQAALKPAGQFVPIDADDDLTLGEVIMHNVYGPLRVRYGAMRDLLLGLRYIDGLGRDIHAGGRTVKNVAGYDLTRFMVGSLGEMGLVYEATVRTYPLPQDVMAVDLHTQTIERLDAGLSRWLTTDAASDYMYARWEGDHWRLRLGYFAGLRSCAVQFQALEKQMDTSTHFQMAAMDQETLEQDRQRRREHLSWWRAVPAAVKIIVPPASTGTTCQALRQKALDAGIDLQMAALPVHGVILAGGALTSEQALALDQTILGLLSAAGASGGTSGGGTPSPQPESGGGCRTWLRRPEPAQVITPFAPMPPELPMLVKLKAALDPHAVLNPGRFLPANRGGAVP